MPPALDWQLELKRRAVGENRTFVVEFPTYNLTFIGATSLPRIQGTVMDYDL